MNARPAPPPAGLRLPDPIDTLLLRAAIHHDRTGLDAWRRVRPGFDVDRADGRQVRLLPLIHRTLKATGEDDPDLARMAGVRRAFWVGSQSLRVQAHRVLGALGGHGVRVMVLKGLALSERYESPGLRPTSDVDIAIRPEDIPVAVRVLRDLGYRAPRSVDHPRGGVYHADVFSAGSGVDVDLHYCVSHHLGPAGISRAEWVRPWWSALAVDEWWSRSTETRIAGCDVHVPSDTDLLLLTMLHGIRFGRSSDVRWAADAALLIREGHVDWDLLLGQAGRRRVATTAEAGLTYLDARLQVCIPREVLDRVRSTRRSWRELAINRIGIVDPWSVQKMGVIDRSRAVTAGYFAQTASEPLWSSLAGFPFHGVGLVRDRLRGG